MNTFEYQLCCQSMLKIECLICRRITNYFTCLLGSNNRVRTEETVQFEMQVKRYNELNSLMIYFLITDDLKNWCDQDDYKDFN